MYPFIIDDTPMSVLNKQCFRFLGIALLLSLVEQVQAADVRVHVIDARQRLPVVDAAVCVGINGNRQQFGALRTDANGDALFPDVPDVPFVVTASKAQFLGYESQHSATRFDFVIEVVLRTGGLGPVCEAASSTGPTSESRLSIQSLAINQGYVATSSRDVTLRAETQGSPTHYRASESPDFAGAEWHEFAGAVKFRLSSGVGNKTVYYQLRRFSGSGNSSLQSVSEIQKASIRLE